jgi:hypothetical protein
VERRREARAELNESVRVTVLSDPPGNPIIGRATDVSGRGMSLVLAQPLPGGALVRIDQVDRMFLGEVVYSKSEEGVFRVGILVDQVLRQTHDLEMLRRALCGEGGAGVERDADVTMKETPHGSSFSRPETDGQPPSHRLSDEGESAQSGAEIARPLGRDGPLR